MTLMQTGTGYGSYRYIFSALKSRYCPQLEHFDLKAFAKNLFHIKVNSSRTCLTYSLNRSLHFLNIH